MEGFTDKMVAFRCTRGEDGYRCETILEPLDIVANFEKKVPASGSMRRATASTSSSSTMSSPDPGRRQGSPGQRSARFARLKKVLTTQL